MLTIRAVSIHLLSSPTSFSMVIKWLIDVWPICTIVYLENVVRIIEVMSCTDVEVRGKRSHD